MRPDIKGEEITRKIFVAKPSIKTKSQLMRVLLELRYSDFLITPIHISGLLKFRLRLLQHIFMQNPFRCQGFYCRHSKMKTGSILYFLVYSGGDYLKCCYTLQVQIIAIYYQLYIYETLYMKLYVH